MDKVEPMRLLGADLYHLLPELTLVIAVFILVLLDLALPKRVGRSIIGWLSIVAILVSIGFVIAQLNPVEPIQLLGKSFIVDDFSNVLKLIFLGATALIVLMSIGSIDKEDIPHHGEYYYFYLSAVLGAMVLASSADFITMFVGLELLSITTYVMVAMRKQNGKSNEGAFKYVVLGGISSAILLYGMSFLYGMTGSTNLNIVREGLNALQDKSLALQYVALFLMLGGFAFKIAAAPFHNWAPDVYEGAPTPVTAFLAVVSKAAAFTMLFRVFYVIVGQGASEQVHNDLFLAASVLAAASMVIGNVTALRQTGLKRLFAYSGIANAGYLLVPISIYFLNVHSDNFAQFAYYLIAYALMNIGAFAAVMIVERASGSDQLRGLSGFYHRAPFTSAAIVLIVLSLAGLPVTGGFFGKLYIIFGTMQVRTYWLGALMIATSVVSFYYYFGLIRHMFMRSGGEESEVKVPLATGITLWFCAISGVVLGLFPQWTLSWLDQVVSILQDLFIP